MTPTQIKEARRTGRPARPLSEWACLDCRVPYEPELFYHRNDNGRPTSRCRKCTNKKTSSKNRDRSSYRRSPTGLAADLIYGPKRRSEKVTITTTWIAKRLKRGMCEVTGLPLDLSQPNGERGPFSPSLDQKIPGGGYTIENTQVVCWIYNSAKGSWSHDDVIKLARAVLQ